MGVGLNKVFGFSLLAGVLIWLICFALLPINLIEPVHVKTVIFIVSNYMALCLGFFMFKYKAPAISEIRNNKIALNFLIGVVLVSFLLRYIDLFYLRELAFTNDISENRYLNELNFKLKHVVFIMASVLKSLYFFPVVMVLSDRQKSYSKLHKIISFSLLVLPLVEAILKATRKPFLEIFFILVISLVVYRGYLLTKKAFVIFGVTALGLILISNVLLFNRESEKFEEGNIYQVLLDADYGKFAPPKAPVKALLLNTETNAFKKQMVFSSLHIGQYIVHGFFEFNHLIQINTKEQYHGAYIFNTIPKLLNIDVPERKAVYLTCFGALYLDFRWFSVVFMLLFGVLQRIVFEKAQTQIIWRPLVVYIVLINLLLLVFCFMRGAGIYPFAGFLIITVLFKIYEKSFST